jgi:hypothetical protein
MAKKRAWEAEDGTVFVERDDGGRDIISPDRGDGKKLYETAEQPQEEADEDEE